MKSGIMAMLLVAYAGLASAQQIWLNNNVMVVKKQGGGAAPVKPIDDQLAKNKGNTLCKFVGYWSDGSVQCHGYTPTPSGTGYTLYNLPEPIPNNIGVSSNIAYTSSVLTTSEGRQDEPLSHLFNYKDTLYGVQANFTGNSEYVRGVTFTKTSYAKNWNPYNSSPDNCVSGCAANYPFVQANWLSNSGRQADVVYVPGIGVVMPKIEKFTYTGMCNYTYQGAMPYFGGSAINSAALLYTANYMCGATPYVSTNGVPLRFFTDLATKNLYFYGGFQNMDQSTGTPTFFEYNLTTRTVNRSIKTDIGTTPIAFYQNLCSWPSGVGKNGKFYFVSCGGAYPNLDGLYMLDINVTPAKTTKIANRIASSGYGTAQPFYYMGVVEKEGKDYLMIGGFDKYFPLD